MNEKANIILTAASGYAAQALVISVTTIQTNLMFVLNFSIAIITLVTLIKKNRKNDNR